MKSVAMFLGVCLLALLIFSHRYTIHSVDTVDAAGNHSQVLVRLDSLTGQTETAIVFDGGLVPKVGDWVAVK